MDLKDILTPFEYVLNNAYNNKGFEELTRKAFQFFVHEDVTLLYDQKMVIIGEIKDVKSVKDLRILRESD